MMIYRAAIVVAVLGVGGAACVGEAWAQSPSADQIIRSLRPTGPTGTTRGIRPVGPAADAPSAVPGPGPGPGPGPASQPAAVGMAAPRPAVAARPPSVDLTVQFASGSAELTPGATRTLDELGRALSSPALSGYRFRVEGHTDTVGTPASNKALSEARAAKVLEYLAGKWNVERARVTPVGMGQEQLVVPTGPGVSQARNRRVTVVNIGA